MFGQLVFAETPFASVGDIPYVERGWVKECPEQNAWNKVPTEASGWQVIDKSRSYWNKAPAEVSGWQVIDKSRSYWDKQPINDVNTIECGDFKITNISRN